MTARVNTSAHVFVSYSRRNIDAMQSISHALYAANIPVWTDERLTAGTPSWKNAIELALQNAFCVVVLMSPTSKSSEWVERELDYAYMLQCPIYPILIEGSQREAVPFELINMQYIDARNDFDQGVKALIDLIIQQNDSVLSPITAPTLEEKNTSDVAIPSPIDNISLEPILPSESIIPSIIGAFLQSFGDKREVVNSADNQLTNLWRIMNWYFFKPNYFRKFSAFTKDSTARTIHAFVTMAADFWIIMSAWLFFSLLHPTDTTNIVTAAIVCYGIVVLLPLSTPYETLSSFFSSMLYAIFLIILIVVVLRIASLLMNPLSGLLGAL